MTNITKRAILFQNNIIHYNIVIYAGNNVNVPNLRFIIFLLIFHTNLNIAPKISTSLTNVGTFSQAY